MLLLPMGKGAYEEAAGIDGIAGEDTIGALLGAPPFEPPTVTVTVLAWVTVTVAAPHSVPLSPDPEPDPGEPDSPT